VSECKHEFVLTRIKNENCRLICHNCFLTELEIELQQDNKSLKCCGNCGYYHTVVNEGRCFVGLAVDEWRFSPLANYVSGDSICDKWQEVER